MPDIVVQLSRVSQMHFRDSWLCRTGSTSAGLDPLAQSREHAVIAEESGLAGGALEPAEHLRGRVGLVVVLAVREGGQLGEVWGEPRRLLGQVHKAVLDHRSLRAASVATQTAG